MFYLDENAVVNDILDDGDYVVTGMQQLNQQTGKWDNIVVPNGTYRIYDETDESIIRRPWTFFSSETHIERVPS